MTLFSKKNAAGKSKPPTSSILMYAGGIVVFLTAVASLVNDVLLINKAVAQYVEQGYSSAEVLEQLIPGQLLPTIFESIGLYAGIAFILLSAGLINHKLSNYLKNTDIIVPSEGAVGQALEEPQMIEEPEEELQKSEEPEETSQVQKD